MIRAHVRFVVISWSVGLFSGDLAAILAGRWYDEVSDDKYEDGVHLKGSKNIQRHFYGYPVSHQMGCDP